MHRGGGAARTKLTARAVFSGLPVARVGRGSSNGFADPHPHFITGSNLIATTARLLLMACLMKFGSLPAAKNPDKPTSQEMAATKATRGALNGKVLRHSYMLKIAILDLGQ